jgi:hypothetical protein
MGGTKYVSALDKLEVILTSHSYRRAKSLDVEFHD